jgi:hypothetical protein
MTQVEEVEVALSKAKMLVEKVEQVIAGLPRKKRKDPSVQRMRTSAHATVMNLGMALQLAKKMEQENGPKP